MIDIKIEAKAYAERVCSGQFPITYSREQVVSYTKNDFEVGANYVIGQIRKILIENQHICKTLTPEDAARSAQDIVNETYEDLLNLISIIT